MFRNSSVCRVRDAADFLQAVLIVATGVLSLIGTSSFLSAAPPGNSNAEAKTEKEMASYTERLSGTDVTFDMLPIRGGVFVMGSPKAEANRNKDEGPTHQVAVEPFWMGKHEVTWDEFDLWSFRLDIQLRKLTNQKSTPADKKSDAVTRPTKPYTDMTFDMGHDGFPAICMTQLAAKMYCKWLSAKTGHFYRLPTEAEWEYACRGGTTTAYSFGDDSKKLAEYAWYVDNSDDKSHKVGKKKPNPWGLYDMHGNVAEWVLDQHVPEFYQRFAKTKIAKFPLAVPKKLYPRVIRGGSWDDGPEVLRSAARISSEPDWKIQDPQIPKSIWYHTDALGVGFRVIRPLKVRSGKIRKQLKLGPVVPKDGKKE